MPQQQWEYLEINLSNLPRETEDVDLLNAAGEEGWVLVAITAKGIAYLKRPVSRKGAAPD